MTTLTVVLNQLSQGLTLAYLKLATYFKWSKEWMFFVLPCPPTQLRDRPNIATVLKGVVFCKTRYFAQISVRIYPLHPFSRMDSYLANRR